MTYASIVAPLPRVVARTSSPAIGALARETLPGSRTDRLYFAQVREDPLLEIAALRPAMHGTIVIIGSGGCTALSLVAEGAHHVVAVDANRAQNHLIELKAAAVAMLGAAGALAFLGGAPSDAAARRVGYLRLRPALGDGAARYWDARQRQIARGVLGAGVTERFIHALTLAIRLGIHPRRRIERLLACRTLEEQRSLFDREWNTRRWRLFFALLLNRRVLRRAYDPAFFEHVENPSFARHFRSLAEHALTRLPVANNYFLHHMLTGAYPASVAGGVPPYLGESGARMLRAERHRLELADAPLTDWLRTQPSESIAGFAISNIGEWLDERGLDELFAEIARTAIDDARLCFRNFVGWTEVPRRWAQVIVEDRLAGPAMIATDRSLVQRRFALCRVTKARA